jgi:hypothetical protein
MTRYKHIDKKSVKLKLRMVVAKNEEVISEIVSGPTAPTVTVKSTNGIADLAGKQHKQFGYCIYCGAIEDLTREHVIPLALSGDLVLPKASCRSCAKITQSFEGPVLAESWKDLRVLLGLRSRSKHAGARKAVPLKIMRNGKEEIINLPLNKYPILLPFPVFAPPRFVTGVEGVGIDMVGVNTISFGPGPEEIMAELGEGEIKIEPAKSYPAAFARMLGKIAYAMAVSESKLTLLDGKSPILPSLLGQENDIGRWVGTLTKSPETYPGLLHRISVGEDPGLGALVAEIQLFSHSATPSYGVILGKLK